MKKIEIAVRCLFFSGNLLMMGLASSEEAQLINPNNLPLCSKNDANQQIGNENLIKWHNCWGMQINSIGDRYVGEFKNGKQNGQGTLTTEVGDKCSGIFKNGKQNGKGICNFAEGSKYLGDFKEDVFNGHGTHITGAGNAYTGDFINGKYHGKGTYINFMNDVYIGSFKKGEFDGFGNYFYSGEIDLNSFLSKSKIKESVFVKNFTYTGYFLNGKMHGKGLASGNNGKIRLEGIWEDGVLIRSEKLNLQTNKNFSVSPDSTEIEHVRKLLSENRRRLEQESDAKAAKKSRRISLQINKTEPTIEGNFSLKIETNTDTASLKINDEEQGGRADGKYSINKIARAGQQTTFTIVATDINGNTDTKTIVVNRPVVESEAKFVSLNPAKVKKQPERDAVAIIIGIADYKNLPRADFANDDASIFYDYAIRALGIKPENIKLLIDANADEVAIYQTFKTWLPSRVRSTTDVYVYYSGHGLPAEDGQELYLLPQRAHRDLIEKTAISQREINSFLEAAKPRSVTLFLDSCYSGMARTGETLLASARPVVIKASKKQYPENFTVITASQADQISSSSPELKHGIFSYYLMRGMQGEADANNDGRITAGEMHGYLAEQVSRQAGIMSRKQEPQLVGDSNRVLVGR